MYKYSGSTFGYLSAQLYLFRTDPIAKSGAKIKSFSPSLRVSSTLNCCLRFPAGFRYPLMDASEIPSKKRRKDNEELCPDDESEIPSSSPEILSPVVVFAHGAGAPSSSDWMIRWKEMIKKTLSAVEVVTFDYPYIGGGKRRVPPKAEKLVEFHLDLVKETAAKFPGHPLILAGKSMGSRVSCMVAASEYITVSAVICLGYPLKGMKGAIRDETLLEMGVPVMFVQGSKDPLCPLDKLQAVCSKMKAVTELHVIDGGDHSFKIGKRHLETKGLTQDQVEDIALQAIAAFVSKSLAC